MTLKKNPRKTFGPMPVATVPITMHPRTALWFEQREQCWVCVHCEASGPSLMCAAAYPRFDRNCITVREEDGVCGPDAKLFVLNEKVL